MTLAAVVAAAMSSCTTMTHPDGSTTESVDADLVRAVLETVVVLNSGK